MSEQTAQQEASREAYAAWMHHVLPTEASGETPCLVCRHAPSPSKGCAEGSLLWGNYRLAKITTKPK